MTMSLIVLDHGISGDSGRGLRMPLLAFGNQIRHSHPNLADQNLLTIFPLLKQM